MIEVNYKTSRVLLLTDLNSNVPVSITPGNVQAIVTGNGDKKGEIKYIKNDLINKIMIKVLHTHQELAQFLKVEFLLERLI